MKDTNIVIGKKNTGKTSCYLFNEVKDAINNGENLCIYDTRDEYFKTFSSELKNNDYNFTYLFIIMFFMILYQWYFLLKFYLFFAKTSV